MPHRQLLDELATDCIIAVYFERKSTRMLVEGFVPLTFISALDPPSRAVLEQERLTLS